ncbi:MAG: transposase [Halanaerobiales bacterium]|nr:transposase [Halanaerobiales bacterium]
MEEKIKELSLLLLYLTSWNEKDRFLGELQRSWKGYPYEILDELSEEGYIKGSNRSKSVYITEEGVAKAQELVRKYLSIVSEEETV